MQSSVLTKPDLTEAGTLERRRPGRFDDVSLELVPILRGEAEPVPDYETVSIVDRDPVAERQTVFKIAVIIVGLVGAVLLFGK